MSSLPPPSGRDAAPRSARTPISDAQDAPGATILVAEDDRAAQAAVSRLLTGAGHRVVLVRDGQAALERGTRPDVDLVLLDVEMPRLSGIEACRLLKAATGDRFLPVVLVTARSDPASRVEGLRIGADDYVCKPFDEDELVARVDALLRVKRLHDHVRAARAKLEELSVHDPLTGVYNYRHLHTRLDEEFARAERYQEPLACLVVDVDGLARRRVEGRGSSDDVMMRVASALRTSMRDVDVVARFGEDEFMVVMPNTHFIGAVKAAERVWKELSAGGLRTSGAPGPVSVSVGASMYPSRDIRTKEALLRGAEAALREAKEAGGDRVCVFQQQGYVYTAIAGDGASDDPRGPDPGGARSSGRS